MSLRGAGLRYLKAKTRKKSVGELQRERMTTEARIRRAKLDRLVSAEKKELSRLEHPKLYALAGGIKKEGFSLTKSASKSLWGMTKPPRRKRKRR